MFMLKLSGLTLAAYLAAGRTGAIAVCLYWGITVWETLIIIFVIDMIQIPVYGLLIEASQRHLVLPERFQMWIKRRVQKLQERMESRKYCKQLASFKPMSVVAVSSIPFRGFGIFSACILSFMLGYNRFTGTFLIMSGSFIGSLLSVAILFMPARWLSGL
jgi:uncharacterized membrane protein